MKHIWSRYKDFTAQHPVAGKIITGVVIVGILVLLDLLVLYPIAQRKRAFNFQGGLSGVVFEGKLYYVNTNGTYVYDPLTRKAKRFSAELNGGRLVVWEDSLYYTGQNSLYRYDPAEEKHTCVFSADAPETDLRNPHPLTMEEVLEINGEAAEGLALLEFFRCNNGWLFDLRSGKSEAVEFTYAYGQTQIALSDGRVLTVPPDPIMQKKESATYDDGTIITVELDRNAGTFDIRLAKGDTVQSLEDGDCPTYFCFDGEWLFYHEFGYGGRVYESHVEKKDGDYILTEPRQIK